MRRQILFLTIAVCATGLWAEKQPYERYQSIVNRQMFGPLPANFDPTKMPSEVVRTNEKQLSKEQEQLKSAIHFSVINVTPDGETAVGFTDKTDAKNPIHYYLKVGESRGGWVVKAADASEDPPSMTIAKDDIEVSLKLGGDSAKEKGATTASTANRNGVNSLGRSSLLGGPASSLRGRREARAEMERKREAEAAQRRAEEKALREEEKREREQERAQQQEQLKAIQEELKRVREASSKKSSEASTENDSGNDEAQ